jgi:hypothetical protein
VGSGGENEAPADATLLQPSVRQRHVLKRVGLRDAKGQLPPLGQGDQLGRTLVPVMVGIKDWAETHMDQVNTARHAYDKAQPSA